MQILDMSGLESIVACENGERLIKGAFDGVRIEQTLPSQPENGFWALDVDINCFVFIAFNGNLKFADID